MILGRKDFRDNVLAKDQDRRAPAAFVLFLVAVSALSALDMRRNRDSSRVVRQMHACMHAGRQAGSAYSMER